MCQAGLLVSIHQLSYIPKAEEVEFVSPQLLFSKDMSERAAPRPKCLQLYLVHDFLGATGLLEVRPADTSFGTRRSLCAGLWVHRALTSVVTAVAEWHAAEDVFVLLIACRMDSKSDPDLPDLI